MHTAEDAEATYVYEYDPLGRVTQETQTIASLTPVVVFSSQYSAVSLRTELSATIGGTADFINTYDYDALGRLNWVKQTDQAGYDVADKRVDFTYDTAGRYDTIIRYADLAATDEVATGTYTFDPLGRITSLIYTQPNSTGLPYYGWTYDAAGNMTWMETIDGEVDYAHDDTNQLTDADYDYRTDEEYTYDSNGNRTNTGYETGPNNQLLSYGPYRYQYDAEGNRTLRYWGADSSETLNSGDIEITEYEWDYRNRLTKVEYFTTYAYYDADTSHQIVEYTYDYANRLIKRVLDPDGTSGATSVEQSIYVYEAGQIVAQFDKTVTGGLASMDMSHRYLWNPQAVDQLFADEQVHWDAQEEEFITDELLWALTDHQNSIRDLAVYDSGLDETTIALHRALDSFGNVASSCGSAECLFDYTGKLFDEATQTQYNWNNWYDAKTARWLSEDREKTDVNLTRYVGNSPLTHVDPTGLDGTHNFVVNGYQAKIEWAQGTLLSALNPFGNIGCWGQPYYLADGQVEKKSQGLSTLVWIWGQNSCNTINRSLSFSGDSGTMKASVCLCPGKYAIIWNWEVSAYALTPPGASHPVGTGSVTITELKNKVIYSDSFGWTKSGLEAHGRQILFVEVTRGGWLEVALYRPIITTPDFTRTGKWKNSPLTETWAYGEINIEEVIKLS